MCNGVFCVKQMSSLAPPPGIKQKYVCVNVICTIQDSQGYHKQYNYKETGRTDLLEQKGNIRIYSMNTPYI